MKQNITPEQLNELSEKGRERLRDWADPFSEDGEYDYTSKDQDFLCVHQCKDGDCQSKDTTAWSMDSEANNGEWWKDAHPLLSIGQMIEFLDDHMYFDCPCKDVETGKPRHKYRDWISIFKDACAGEWFMHDTSQKTYKEGKRDRHFVGELADMLWEGVKEILEDDNKDE